MSGHGSHDIVMLVLNDVQFDGRVRREAAALAGAGWRVLVVGTQRADGRLPDREMIQGFDVQRVRYSRLGAGLWRPWRTVRHVVQAVQIIRKVRRFSARAYHAHDLPALLLLTVARLNAPLVYDSHELYLFQPPEASRIGAGLHRLLRPVALRGERFLARRAAVIITVGDTCARLLARSLGVARPVVVHNMVDAPGTETRAPLDLRALAGGRRCVAHTGTVTNRGRALTELVMALPLLPDDVALVFLGRAKDADQLTQTAARLGVGERVIFVPPVPPEQVATTLRGADAAVVLLRPDTWNIRAAVPNKLFEAVAGGVPVVATDTFTMRRFVQRYGLGRVCASNDPAAIAAALNAVLAEREAFHAHVTAAQTVLNWQQEAAKLCAVYREILP